MISSFKKSSCRAWAIGCLAVVAALFAVVAPASAGSEVLAPEDAVAQSLQQMQSGDSRGAAQTLREALDRSPETLLLHEMAASLLFLSGDLLGAGYEWGVVLAREPSNGLAHYGLGLIAMARGDRPGAQGAFQKAEAGGDRTLCLLATRYNEFLKGALGSGVGLSLPGTHGTAALGLSGIASLRTGDSRRALKETGEAMSALSGDRFTEIPGLLMTFREDTPLRYAFSALPRGNRLAVARINSTKSIAGMLTVKPDFRVDSGYVVLKVDDRVHSMVNSPPYQMQWDTTRVTNGLHRLDIEVYDRSGTLVSRMNREVTTKNESAPAAPSVAAGTQDAVRSALWQMLSLPPSRAALAYAAAEAARRLGDKALYATYVEMSVALSPDYRDGRARLLSMGVAGADKALWRGAVDEKVVALTFDDGPKPGVTEEMLHILTKERVPSTFFVIGRHATAYPDIIRKLAQSGMQIENHSYTHPNLTLLRPADIERELLRTSATVRQTTGIQMRYFRPPGGNINPEVMRIANQWGLTACMWTIDGMALETGSPDFLVDFVVKKTCPGAVILLHNGRRTTIEALPRIIDGLRKRGYRFVTINELVRLKSRQSQISGRDIRD